MSIGGFTPVFLNTQQTRFLTLFFWPHSLNAFNFFFFAYTLSWVLRPHHDWRSWVTHFSILNYHCFKCLPFSSQTTALLISWPPTSLLLVDSLSGWKALVIAQQHSIRGLHTFTPLLRLHRSASAPLALCSWIK